MYQSLITSIQFIDECDFRVTKREQIQSNPVEDNDALKSARSMRVTDCMGAEVCEFWAST